MNLQVFGDDELKDTNASTPNHPIRDTFEAALTSYLLVQTTTLSIGAPTHDVQKCKEASPVQGGSQ